MICDINPHILRYIEAVESGEIRVCAEQHLLVRYVRDCFAEEDIYTDGEQLEKYIGLAEYFPFERLFPWQIFVEALHLCTYWRDTGQPRWPDLFCLIGRGAGKDGTIAHESVCVMSPYNGIRAYDVDVCANNEDQALRPMQDVIEAFESPNIIKKMRRHFYWTKEAVTALATKSTMKGRTNSPKGKDGLRSGIVFFNEIHQYSDYKNINVFTTGLGKKRHPRRGYYTTNGNVRDGPLDDLLEKSERILNRENPDNGLLPFICKLDSRDEVDDPENWVKANPSLPYLPELRKEIEKEYRDWKESPGQLSDFMTKRMNLPQSCEAQPVTEWDNIAATSRELPDLTGWQCVAGIDFSSIRDWASVDLHFKRGEDRYDITHSWICTQSPELARVKAPWREWGEVTPVDDVEIPPELIAEYIAAAAARYYIVAVAIDNFRFALLRKALEQIGFDPKERKNIWLLRPSDIMRVQPVIDSCFNKGLYSWGDAPSLRWATNNTKLVRAGRKEGTDTGNFYYAKIEGKSRKTDPFMALVAASAKEDLLCDGIPDDFPDLGVITG